MRQRRGTGSEIHTLATKSEMSEVGCSSKRKLPSLDLILTSFVRVRNGNLGSGERTDHDERQEMEERGLAPLEDAS
jgi:hypothetical protein